jgi:membrane protein implicated in regulation of membrane protease activity
MLTALLTLLAIAVAGMVLFALVFGAIALVFGVVFAALALAFKVVPLLLLGWLVVKLVRRAERPKAQQLTPADRAWLDS